MQRDLHIPASLYPWITTAYLVVSTVMVPIYGKLSDSFGRKRILMIGIALFVSGSALCGFSRTTVHLILFRALQGSGAAALFTSAFAVIADIFPPAVRGKYTGLFGAVFGLSSIVGPLLGGFLTDRFGWNWVFFVNVPLGIIALIFIWTRMPVFSFEHKARPAVDYLGALSLACFVVPFLVALSLAKVGPGRGELGWHSLPILGLMALAILSFVAFVYAERRAPDPLLDLKLFSNRVFGIGNAAAFTLGGSFLSSIVFLPLFMVNVVGLSATSSGLTMTPLVLGTVFGNVVSGQLVTRLGRYKPLMIIGLLILLVSFGVLGWTLTPHSTEWGVTLKMVLVGLGLGPAIPLYTLAIQNAVTPQQIGVATSTVTFFRQMGQTIGVAVLGAVFATVFASQMRARLPGVPVSAISMSGAARSSPTPRAAPARSTATTHDRVPTHDPIPSHHPLKSTGGSKPAGDSKVLTARKEAFSIAIEDLYRLNILVTLLGLGLTIALPELPLRKTNRMPAGAGAS
jgi:EmrB/QacA subfamily drug resistance transporter